MEGSITWLGHSCFRLVLGDGRVILIDPWLKDNPACPKNLKQPDRCDFVLLTHGHFDHVGDTEALIQKFDPTVVGNYDLCSALEKQVGKGRFAGMNTGGTQNFEGLRVSLTRAYHSSGLDSPKGPLYAGMPNGIIVAANSLATLYHAGDTDVFSDMKLIAQMYAPKICILPIGDVFTMGARGAALAAEMLAPVAVIPCHYKTFPVLAQSAEEFRKALPSSLRNRLYALDAGRPLTWTELGVR
jgi:L-ascorbate metabolism protein UlaG (beta-lactamase superfamily)